MRCAFLISVFCPGLQKKNTDVIIRHNRAPHFGTLEVAHAAGGLRSLAFGRGGTSLALQYGHLQSIDLDLFGQICFDSFEIRQVLSKIGRLTVVKETSDIKIYFLDGIKVDIVNYAYPWIDDAVEEDGLRLASDKDIAAMKINAIEGRGSKKDFIDLYFLLKHYTLQEILDFYCRKYPENSVFRAILSLSYFDDAETQMTPAMFTDNGWEEIKAHLADVVKKFE